MNVLIFAGSSREGSYNKKLATEAAGIARQLGAKVTTIDLRDFSMPFYDADLESKGMPRNATRLRDLMIASDAVVIASPEYNGSLPAVLKNALDWASRSEDSGASRSAFKGKKFAIMSASPGRLGGARALGHLRALIEEIGGEVIAKQVAVPAAYEAFNEQGLLATKALKERLQEEMQALLGE